MSFIKRFQILKKIKYGLESNDYIEYKKFIPYNIRSRYENLKIENIKQIYNKYKLKKKIIIIN